MKKLKAEIVDDPPLRQIIKDPQFTESMNEVFICLSSKTNLLENIRQIIT